jgi:hypothetical protein
MPVTVIPIEGVERAGCLTVLFFRIMPAGTEVVALLPDLHDDMVYAVVRPLEPSVGRVELVSQNQAENLSRSGYRLDPEWLS